jgi:hypothetical protein
MKAKLFKVLILILTMLLNLIIVSLLVSCDDAETRFKKNCTTTEDGFVYYNRYLDNGAYIIEVPDVEELVIPEYIDGKMVKGMAYRDTLFGYGKDYTVVGNATVKLTIQHQFRIKYPESDFVDFPNLKSLVFLDFLYCNAVSTMKEILVPYCIGKGSKANLPIVELRKTNREFSLDEFMTNTILIPDYVKIIDADVFAGLIDVVIKTSYETNPVGWEYGWNGNCEVEWGAELKFN